MDMLPCKVLNQALQPVYIVSYLLVLSATTVLCSQITTPPKDTTGIVGEFVTLSCEAQFMEGEIEALEWTKEDLIGTSVEYIFISLDQRGNPNNQPYNPAKYSIEGNYNLLIKDLTLEDGGIYRCRLLFSKETASANLVIMSEPIIGGPMEGLPQGTLTNITCEMTYSGPPDSIMVPQRKPQLHMLMDHTVVQREYVSTFSGTTGKYTLSQTWEYEASAGDDRRKIHCEGFTETPYQIVESFTALDITYGVPGVEVFPRKSAYHVGDVITCSANGKPPPVFTWTADASPGKNRQDGSELEMTLDMVGQNAWNCVAQNQVGGQVYLHETSLEFVVDVPHTEGGRPGAGGFMTNTGPNNNGGQVDEVKTSSTSGVVIAIAIIIPIVVIIILIGVVLYCRKTRRKKSHIYSPRKESVEADNRSETDRMSARYSVRFSVQPDTDDRIRESQRLNNGRNA